MRREREKIFATGKKWRQSCYSSPLPKKTRLCESLEGPSSISSRRVESSFFSSSRPLALPTMLSPTFRGDRDGRNKPSLDHGRLQAALFAAAASAMGGTGHGVAADEIPPTSFPARVPSDDDDEAPAAPAATGESAAKAPSRRGRAPAVGAAE